ncbi:hypothetical protein Trco_000776 [Trichoderma cornu-damae]|uniref:Uncharacterized protein n=1 Tax=Trichoderma cornu-damae TaxID=654480 RepID=A0A9P8QSU7_9HYPO|nr:hypothetical protein Trco_000776 [Trichoderma cornu-damae]
MPQEQDALRKIGRGGAGNYVSSKQAEEASKDLEARQLKALASAPSTAPSQGPAKAGRGGAGNFIDTNKYAAWSRGQLADETGAAAASQLKKHPQPHRAGWSGRGGAGNFNPDSTAEDDRRRQEEARGKAAELDRKIREAVDGALKLPERAHHHLTSKEDEEG